MIEVPPDFQRRRIRADGDAAETWLRVLPSKVVELENLWGLTIDGEPMHGETSLVLPVLRDGELLALKITYPHREAAFESAALRAWGGNGAVRLVEYDKQRNAMLLERLDGSRSLANVDREEAVDVASGLLKRCVAPSIPGPEHLVDIVDGLTVMLDRAQREVPAEQVEFAREWLEAYFPQGDEMLVNSDLHYDNVLAATRESWLVIDPKPIIGEVAYGIAPLLWNLTPQELSSSLLLHFDRILEIAEVDRERAVRWTVVRMIDFWISTWNQGLTQEPAKAKHIVQALINRR